MLDITPNNFYRFQDYCELQRNREGKTFNINNKFIELIQL